MAYYMDKYTGELLTYLEMKRALKEKYDGDDETNCVSWTEYFEKVIE